ncbi:MAG TPA: GatB/YqeY domain-containing protein [Methanosarcina sp.]|nr:GatB/YqeY domain-containing protein [Methanosarcina sp.]
MLIAKLKEDQLSARKGRLTVQASLLTTIIGEAEMVGKNAGNRAPTDDEVTSVLKKFEKNLKENERIYGERNMQDELLATQKELLIVRLYLPKKIDDAQIKADIETIVARLGLAMEQKSMGAIVKELRGKYGVQFDGDQVSTVFRGML